MESKMRKKWLKIQQKFFNPEDSLRMVLFNIITLSGIGGGIIGFVMSIILDLYWVQILAIFAALIVLIGSFYQANWRGHLKQAAFSIVSIITLVLFPVMFFTDGGAFGGMGYWFTLGLVFDFLIVEGAAFYVLLVLQVITILSCYWIAYCRPEWVVPIGTTTGIYVDMIQSLIVLGLVLGLINKFQNKVYKKALDQIGKQNEALVESEYRADMANRAKSEFLSSISHEIRTPINIIIGMNEMILKEADSQQLLEYAEAVDHSANTLLSLISDVLDISKIEAGKVEIEEENYRPAELLVECNDMIQERAKAKGLTLKIHCEEDLPRVLCGDVGRIRQILLNLLTNAVKYTEKGTVSLHLGGERKDGELRLCMRVKDTGIGIAPENLERIFEKFERFDLEKNRTIEGTGLGLSIVKELTERMNGTVEAASTYGEGSEFMVTVPQHIIEETPIGLFDINEQKRHREKRECPNAFLAKNAAILVVDDVQMNLNVFVNLLLDTQIRVDTALSGREALRLVQEYAYDIIFMDHMMPDMDGVETLRTMRKLPHHKNERTPVIMLTANVQYGIGDMYREEGFREYLSKPIRGSMLKERILRYLPKEKVQILKEENESGEVQQESSQADKSPEEKLGEEIPGMDVKAGLLYCGKDPEFYRQMLREYSTNGRIDRLRKDYEEEDWHGYQVEVHALKSTSRTLGIMELGEYAAVQEERVKQGKLEEAGENHEELMKELEKVNRILGSILDEYF